MRKIIIAGIIFFFIFGFLPVINCEDEANTKHTFCELYDTCTVDVYYPMSLIIFNGCPFQDVSAIRIGLITVLFLGITILLTYGIDYLYVKYRDI